MNPYLLIVDDEFGFADVLADLLATRGYDVNIAINGKLGLEALEARVPDLVLTDLTMPVMDGTEMISAMRADPRFARIPVILMTALPEAIPKREPALHDATLVKPFSLAVLLEVVVRLTAR